MALARVCAIYSITPIASALPSSGDVLLPISSRSIRLSFVNEDVISARFLICDENVDRFWLISWSSPISQYILSNTDITLPSPQGTSRPHASMQDSRPTVLSDAVFPPVLGPEMMSILHLPPTSMSIGTTRSRAISGCLAFTSDTRPVLSISGSMPSMELPYLPRAKYISRSASRSDASAILSD